MNSKIFVNLPVKDLEKSKTFFGKLSYTFNAQFTDETGTCSRGNRWANSSRGISR